MDAERSTIPLLRINQWLETWDQAKWDEENGLGKPSDHFYVGSMPLALLRNLAGVSEREIEQRKDPNTTAGYQRALEKSRATKIRRYVGYGYPLSTSTNLSPDSHPDLINPGWLPNAIIVNIIPTGETRVRRGVESSVPKALELKIREDGDSVKLELPTPAQIEKVRASNHQFIEPIEVIDGQHRLYAWDFHDDPKGSYEVPVVIFNNLSLNWQAYLFWTINVEPKRINASLAFDLYPELRRQDWLEQSEAIKIYQEHRSQEMTEVLWSHPESPWRGRIELHGKRIKGHVSNAAFIRSLTSSFIKKWAQGERIGGLFGSIPNQSGGGRRVIPWRRAQQAAFLIRIWQAVASATGSSNSEWVKTLKDAEPGQKSSTDTPAFSGTNSLLATDQGVRAIHNIYNAIFQHSPETFDLLSWETDEIMEETPSESSVSMAIRSLSNMKKADMAMKSIAETLVSGFDWRLSSAPGLTDEKMKIQSSYRGSGGYSQMMKELIVLISKECSDAQIQSIAQDIGNRITRK